MKNVPQRVARAILIRKCKYYFPSWKGREMKSVDEMSMFFDPRSVAVVGASRKIMKAGHVIFKNFAVNKRRGIFKGELYPINLHED